MARAADGLIEDKPVEAPQLEHGPKRVDVRADLAERQVETCASFASEPAHCPVVAREDQSEAGFLGIASPTHRCPEERPPEPATAPRRFDNERDLDTLQG